MRRTELAVGASIFCFTCAVFLLSMVQQAADSNYSMLLSESLLYHRTFALDDYAIPRLEPKQQRGWVADGEIYQLEYVNRRLYYFFPPGSSVLSIPYVALMNRIGISAANPDGTYNLRGELVLEKYLAALLMAALSAVIFFTVRLILPMTWSILIALGSALGTQVWSTASRALWSDTWATFLLGIVVWMLLAHETREHRLRPILLASLLAWCYFVRPTSAIVVVAITVYVFLYCSRSAFARYVITGAVWLAGFALFSFYNFGQLLPNYYRPSRLTFATFPIALAGNLISPSRGLLIFVPIIIFVAYLLLRYAKELTHRPLIAISLSIIVMHHLVAAGFSPWWGGHCYGPRYMTALVPWFVLLSILAIDAALLWRKKPGPQSGAWRPKMEWIAGAVLLLCSMFINGRGAMNPGTSRWNFTPVNVDEHPERVWDWKDPQFLR